MLNHCYASPPGFPLLIMRIMQGGYHPVQTHHPLSAIGFYQAHAQLNVLVKCDGGVVDLTENPAALIRWMMAEPAIDLLHTGRVLN